MPATPSSVMSQLVAEPEFSDWISMSVAPNPPPYGMSQPPQGVAPIDVTPAQPGRNGLAVAGLVLAFLAAPIGFVLSLVAMLQTGKAGQRGRGLAIAGIVVSLIVMAGAGTAVAVAASKAGDKLSTVIDPGCTAGKAAVLDNAGKASDPNTSKEGLQATLDGLNAARTKAKHANVRDALTTLSDDYKQLLAVANGTIAPPDGIATKLQNDADAVDRLCTIKN